MTDNFKFNPRTWIVPDDDCREYLYECLYDIDTTNSFTLFQSDDGWAVRMTVRTAGACSSISQVFLLPKTFSEALDVAHETAEEMLVWESGLGLRYEI